MPMMLIPLDGGRPIPVDKAILFFGRGNECDVVLNSSRKVSRKHCCLAQIDDQFLVKDLGSMNGIRVNDQVVTSESRIRAGDKLWIGDVGFLFQKPTAENQRAAKQKPATISPHMISTDLPVAIPDQSEEFIVEESMASPLIPDDEIHELSEDDILE